jgi:hypothetical protein
MDVHGRTTFPNGYRELRALNTSVTFDKYKGFELYLLSHDIRFLTTESDATIKKSFIGKLFI